MKSQFLIRFTANKRHYLGRYFRAVCNADKLHEFIGKKNAITALSGALCYKGDKYVVKFRKYGRVEFFAK